MIQKSSVLKVCG